MTVFKPLPTGGWKSQDRNKTDVAPVRPNPNLQPLSVELLDFFARRGISPATLEAAGVMQEHLYAPPLRETADTIAFAYRRRGQLINVKYRTIDKKFWQARAESSIPFYLPSTVLHSHSAVPVSVESFQLCDCALCY